MKKNWKNISNFLVVLIFSLLLWKQAPSILNNWEKRGGTLETNTFEVLTESQNTIEKTVFPPPNQKVIVLFWASWCGPCKIEMNRLQHSVTKNKISKNKIYAINPFETREVVLKFLRTHKYSFTFIDAQEIVQKLNIQSTPTTIFLDDNKITSMSSGLSLIGIWRAEWYVSSHK